MTYVARAGWLEWLSGEMVSAMQPETDASQNRDYLKVITSPLVKLVIQVSPRVFTIQAHLRF